MANFKRVWPEHVVHLAQAFHNGEMDVIDPLYDALVEFGYPVTAKHHFGKNHCVPGVCWVDSDQSACSVVWHILNNEYFADMPVPEMGAWTAFSHESASRRLAARKRNI